jgi:hypothetical protein
MNAENQKAVEVLSPLTTTITEQAGGEEGPGQTQPPEKTDEELSGLIALARDITRQGIDELDSPLSE